MTTGISIGIALGGARSPQVGYNLHLTAGTQDVAGAVPTYYIDPTADPGGNGSYAAPWDDFTETNLLTGDLGGRQLLLKSGTTMYDSLLLTGASNFSIGTYDGSVRAIIDGSAEATGWVWTNAAGDLWSTTSAGSEKAVFVGSRAFERANNGSTNPQQSVMDRCELTYWYGTHSVHGGGNKLWVHAPAGMNMTTETAAGNVRVQSRNFAVRGVGCSQVTVRDIQVQRGFDGTLAFNEHGAGLLLENVLSQQNGLSPTNLGQNTADISGVSEAVPATGVTIRNCVFRDNYGGSNNNGTEFSYIDGLLIEDCTYQRILGNAVEFWHSVKNTHITRCKMLDLGNSAYWASNASSENHRNTQIDNCIMVATGNYTKDHASNPMGSLFARIQGSSDTRLYNNTVITNASNAVRLEKGSNVACTNTVTMKNNIVIDTAGSMSGAGYRIQTLDSGWVFVPTLTGAPNEIVSDRNQLYTYHHAGPAASNLGYVNSVATVGLANWQAQSGNPDPNSSEANPVLAAMLGTPGITTTLTSTVSAGSYSFPVASAAGFAVGDRFTVPLVAAPRIWVGKIVAISGNTLTTDIRVSYSTVASGATITKLGDYDVDMTPAATPPRNSGIGSATDANVPTVDLNNTPRSPTTPDIGAIEI